MIDWIFQFSSGWLALRVYGLVLPVLVPPPQWVLKVTITDSNASKLVMGCRVPHHMQLMWKLTSSVPKVISVHQSSLSLSSSIYQALTCAKHIFKWKTSWQTLADEIFLSCGINFPAAYPAILWDFYQKGVPSMYYILISEISLSFVSPILCPLSCLFLALCPKLHLLSVQFVCYILPLSLGSWGMLETQCTEHQKPEFHLAFVTW